MGQEKLSRLYQGSLSFFNLFLAVETAIELMYLYRRISKRGWFLVVLNIHSIMGGIVKSGNPRGGW